MKRSRIIISVIIAVIVVVALANTGTAYFTGKKYEQEIATGIADLNKNFDTNQTLTKKFGHLHVSVENYQRGVLSSQFQIVLSHTKMPQQPMLVLDQKIQHGPFPFAEIARLNLLPASVIEIIPAKTGSKLNESLTTLAQGKAFFTMNLQIDLFNPHIRSITMHIAPLHYQDKDKQFDFAGGVIKKVHNIKEKIPEDINSDIFDKIMTNLTSGKISLEAGKITYISHSQPVLSIDDISYDIQTLIDDKTFSEDINLTFKGLTVKQQLIGDGDLSVQIKNLDKLAMTDYLQFLAKNKDSPDALQTDPAYQQQIKQKTLAIMKNADITINPISLRNDKGLLKYTFYLSLNDINRLNEPNFQEIPLPIIKYVFKNLDSKLELSKAATEKLIGQISCLSNNVSCQQAEQEATQQINTLVMLGQSFHLITSTDETITSDIHLKDGMATINGETMPLEKFINQYLNIK